MDGFKTRRAAIKAKLTRFNNYLGTEMTSEEILNIESRLERALPLYDEFDEVQRGLEALAVQDAAQLATQEQERNSFETSYFAAISRAKGILKRLKAAEAPSSVNASTHSHDDDSSINNGRNSTGMHLPKINLPIFDGDYSSWLKFRDTFESTIHQNTSISDINKFHYLNSSLKGDALDTISSIGLSGANYEAAWKEICERYDDSDALVEHHLHGIFSMPPMTKGTHTELRQLINGAKNHLAALKSLGEDVDHWDRVVIHTLTSRLDDTAKAEWKRERRHFKGKLKLKDFMNCLGEHFKFLESMSKTKPNQSSNNREANKGNKRTDHTKAYATTLKTQRTCPLCSESHGLYACKRFKELSVPERTQKTRELGLCFNCLGSGHGNRECKFGPCRRCGRRHNALLHSPESGTAQSPQTTLAIKTSEPLASGASSSEVQSSYLASGAAQGKAGYVLLGTASVYLLDRHGKRHQCRALLDSGSQAHIITDGLCKRLGISQEETDIPLSGIEQGLRTVRHKATVRLFSHATNYSATISCLVLHKIGENFPSAVVQSANIQIPHGIELADPHFSQPGPVDLLLGAAIFFDLLCVGQIKLNSDSPTLQKTLLGWIISGRINIPDKNQAVTCNLVRNEELSEQIERFWKIENCFSETNSTLALKNDYVEQHFVKTTRRDENGRFIVNIPFKERVEQLGNSEEMARKRFFQLEKKLSRNPALRQEYTEFMREYERLDHMTEIPAAVIEATRDAPKFYLPHHAVIKESSTTTKLRVVFDGSAKTSSGLSLNDIEHVGPNILEDLFSILVRARQRKYVMSADVAKMYRQILVTEEQRDFQRIIWRENHTQPIKHFVLNTVTYGTKSAAYLSSRCLKEIARIHLEEYPIACRAILEDFYVDDLLSGSDTFEGAIKLRSELTKLLATTGMELRKWASNDSRILDNKKGENNAIKLQQSDKDPKTLGLIWEPQSDILKYNVTHVNHVKVTKRIILSIIAQIYDPLGLVGPAVIQAKIIMQRLWALNINWDESLPQDIHASWLNTYEQLMQINDLKIPRLVIPQDSSDIELHGFGDASEKAYGACIYVRSKAPNGNYSVHLLCAKSRVAPLKNLSLPRLELLGAQLLAQLAHKVTTACNHSIEQWHFWSDSTVVLAWLKAPPNKWKTFVANRTAEIQELTNSNWHHVESAMNPADLISRGIDAAELRSSELWWRGPAWLAQNKEAWPKSNLPHIEAPESKNIQVLIAQEVNSEEISTLNVRINKGNNKIFDRFSSFWKLNRITAYSLRFIGNCRAARGAGPSQVEEKCRNDGKFTPLSTQELKCAMHRLVLLAQAESFKTEITNLKNGKQVPKTSKLNQLNPFLDEIGILRVGGRLDNAAISFERKHPIILAENHKLTDLLIEFEHKRLLHAGCQAVLSSLRYRYWPLAGKNTIKKIIRRCMKCFRAHPIQAEHIMGNLPETRVTPARPFYNCGVDFAGPFLIKEKARSRVPLKAYVCTFVCFATKAIHIELVSDLSTAAFLNCFKRFISRRGRCKNVYSDNGTNFVGASNELASLQDLIKGEEFRKTVIDFLVCEEINWHFIPPRAPHFGGLWESAVKSVKFHLKRVIGETRLTYEEFYTVLAQVEACLNSRPLSPLSNDPQDLTPLTPAHFLIGDSLVSLPDTDISTSRSSRYQHLQQMLKHFWQRWHREYLPQLQKRQKWTRGSKAMEPDAMVLIREDNIPPMQWPLGRIAELYPGKDGIVRVVSVRTARGIIKRPVARICPLPLDQEEVLQGEK